MVWHVITVIVSPLNIAATPLFRSLARVSNPMSKLGFKESRSHKRTGLIEQCGVCPFPCGHDAIAFGLADAGVCGGDYINNIIYRVSYGML